MNGFVNRAMHEQAIIMINIEDLRKLCKENKIEWTLHAVGRIRKRHIRPNEVIDCILNGEIIEQYENDKPYQSCLLYCDLSNKYLHVVAGVGNKKIYIVTAYVPNTNEWENDFKTRKE